MTARQAIALLPFVLLAVDTGAVAAWLWPHGPRALVVACALPLGLVVADWMDILRARLLVAPLGRVAVRGAAVWAVLSAAAPYLRVDRDAFDLDAACALATLLLLRWLLGLACRAAERRGFARERVAILGALPLADRLARRLGRPGSRGLAVAGRFEDTPDGIAKLLELGRAGAVDRVLLALPADDSSRIRRAVWQCKALDVPVERYASLADAEWPDTPVGRLDDLPVAELLRRPLPAWGRAIKRLQDAVLGATVLVAVLPVLLAVAIAVRLDSPGPVLFRQAREGRNGARFDILKFRTMSWQPSGAGSRVQQTARHDQRVTRVGRVLRATSLDELPQLLNVLRGDMSLVGPRPHPEMMTTENRLSVEIAEDYPQRHRVKPGMTGWAQVNGSRGALASAEDLCRRLRYDLDYIENWSPLLDLKIALLTPLKLIFHGGSAF